MNPSASDLLKYANVQMAAEALFGLRGAAPGRTYSGPITTDMLIAGNGRASVFTATGAATFVQEWEVVEHKSNTLSGFSGTLFHNTVTQELVLSFRSTEFVDDSARDAVATSTLEIRKLGWAFGQIDDMRNWVDSLYVRDKLSPEQPLKITGYSLGGHLATAFHQLYPGTAAATYTFNGAGVGDIQAGLTLSTVMDVFSSRRDPGNNADLFTDIDTLNTYDSYKRFFNGSTPASLAEVESAIDVVQTLKSRKFPGSDAEKEADLLSKALTRIREIALTVQAVQQGLPSGGDGPPAAVVPADQIPALGLDYQLAVLTAARYTSNYRGDLGPNGVDAIMGRNTRDVPLPNFYDVFGSNFGVSDFAAVANSQWHYGVATPIWIEDQPLRRGNIQNQVAESGWKEGEIRLLQPGFSINDFGDTHSLVLLVDSLVVQDALARLDPQLDEATISAIFNAARGDKTTSEVFEQGTADGNTLECIINCLASALCVTDVPRLQGSTTGNTWWNVKQTTGNTGRELLHSTAAKIVAQIDEPDFARNVTVTASGVALKDLARNNFGAVIALQDLAPLWLSGANDAGAEVLKARWQLNRTQDYDAWTHDLITGSAKTFTNEWILDRSVLLEAMVYLNRPNSDSQVAFVAAVPADRNLALQYYKEGDATATELTAWNGNGNTSSVSDARKRQNIIFDNADAHTLAGQDSRLGDHIYGDAGNDTLDGKGGNDHLEGGKDFDTYNFSGKFGQDTIVDSDGQGRIWVDGIALSGSTTAQTQASSGQPYIIWREKGFSFGTVVYRWNSLTGDLNIAAGNGGITVRNYARGDLGISAPPLPEVTPPPPPQTTFNFDVPGDRQAYALADTLHSNANLELKNTASAYDIYGGNPLGSAWRSAAIVRTGSGDDLIEGGTSPAISAMLMSGGDGKDRIFAGVSATLQDAIERGDSQEVPVGSANWQTLDGGAGADLLVGSDSADALFGGDGDDTLVGGNGNDIIIADGRAGGMLQNGNADVTAPIFIGQNDAYGGLTRVLRVEHAGVKLGVNASDTTGQRTAKEVHLNFYLTPLANTSLSALQNFQDTDVRGQGYTVGSLELTADQPYGTRTNYAGDVGPLETNIGRGDDVIYAGNGDDVVNAGAGEDFVFGGRGVDMIAGYEGTDYIDGGDGDDRLFGDYTATAYPGEPATEITNFFGQNLVVRNTLDGSLHARDFIHGGAGSDIIFGQGGGDYLYGGADADWVFGDDIAMRTFTGADYIEGEEGSDFLFGGAGGDQIEGGAGQDILVGDMLEDDGASETKDYLDGGDDNDFLWGGAGDDELFGGAGEDVLRGDATASETALSEYLLLNTDPVISTVQGDDYLDGEDGRDHLYGDGGDDRLWGGNDTDALYGGTGDDELHGEAGDDLLEGGEGDDSLDGGSGLDLLRGGAGDDVYVVSVADGGTTPLQGMDHIEDDEGHNTLRIEGATAADLSVYLTSNEPEGLAIRFGGAGGLTASANWVYVKDGLDGGGVQSIEVGGQTITVRQLVEEHLTEARQGWSTKQGSVLLGGVADDDLSVYGSDNQIHLGRGNDHVYAGGEFNTISLAAGGGNDTVDGYWLESEWANNILLFEGAITPQQVQLGRDDQGRILLTVDENTSMLVRGGIGFVRFEATGEQLSLRDFVQSKLDAQATSGNDVIQGTLLGDHLAGGAGDDILFGEEGDDQLLADAGNDLLAGGYGDDTYTIAAGAHARLLVGLHADDDAWAGGTDRIVLPGSADTATWTATVEDRSLVLTIDPGNGEPAATVKLDGYFNGSYEAESWANASIEFADGSILPREDILAAASVATEGADTLLGTSLADFFNGLGGNDAMEGFDGDDVLSGGAGNDMIGGGGGDDVLHGDAGDDDLGGGDGADTLDGGAGADVLAGGDGNDALDGGDGADVLQGEAGDDNLHGGEGDDVLAGGLGNDVLVGGTGADVLQGGQGEDILEGGAGDDFYVVETLGDEADLPGETDLVADTQGADVIRLGDVDFNALSRTMMEDGTWKLSWAGGSVRIQGGSDALQRIAIATADSQHILADVAEFEIPQAPQEGEIETNSAFLARKEVAARYQIAEAGRVGALGWRASAQEPRGTRGEAIASDAADLDVSQSSYENVFVPYTYTIGYYRDAQGNTYNSRTYTEMQWDTTWTYLGTVEIHGQGSGEYREEFLERTVMRPVTRYRTGLTYVTETRTGEYTIQKLDAAPESVDAVLGPSDNAFTFSAGLARGGEGDDDLTANLASFSRDRYMPRYGMDWGDVAKRVVALSRRDATLLTGATTATWMDGGDGNDHLQGSEVADTLYGGRGVNLLEGGVGPDRYLVLEEEDDEGGYDRIEDLEHAQPFRNPMAPYYGGPAAEILPPGADIDTVEFGPGIRLEQITGAITQDNEDEPATLTLSNSGRKLVEIALTQDQLEGTAYNDEGVEFFEFQGGQRVSMAEMLGHVRGASDGPKLLVPLPDAQGDDKNAFLYVVPAGSFRDPADPTLALEAGLADGGPLPDWLEFTSVLVEGVRRWQLQGTPPLGSAETLQVRITARNDGGASASDVLALTLSHVNGIPQIQQELQAPDAVENEVYRWELPQTAFADADEDALTWTFTPANAQAAWLQFDPVARTLTGTAPHQLLYSTAHGTITVTDPSGATASQEVSVFIGDPHGIVLTGTDGDDTLVGTAGSDYIDGGLGADTMRGGKSSDVYTVDSALDVVIERANEGRDTVIAAVDWTLGANVENLTLVGTAVDGTGNGLANRITGNAEANRLRGGTGDDELIGRGGDDWLQGGTGADRMEGGAGDDLYDVDAAGDEIVELAGAGSDTVHASVSVTLAANVENLVLTGTADIDGTGNGLANLLQGNAGINQLQGGGGDDVLDGRAGLDTLVGGLGNDTYTFEDDLDIVLEQADGGRDTLLTRFSATLAENVEDGVLTGSAIGLTGNALSNVLTGNSAANVLDGGSGSDVMAGRLGNDRYIVDSTADTVVEAANGGIDSVEAQVSYALADNVENLILVGSAEAGLGNDLANRLVGTAGSNKLFGDGGNDDLDGGAGADVLFGGTGNDRYEVDSADDLVVELAGEGTDTVYASVSHALADNVENLVLVGSADINAVGNAGNNRIEGNAGRNILFGGLGNDTYVFGRGSGQDIVANFDAGKPSGDRVQLGAGLMVADIGFARIGDDLVLSIQDSTDQLTVADYFVNAGKGPTGLERIRFADGTSLDHAGVLNLLDSTSAAGDPGLSPAVRSGDATSLYTEPSPQATAPHEGEPQGGQAPQSIGEAIALARQRFEAGLRQLRLTADEDGAVSREEFAERRTLPMLWNLQDALSALQLARNPDGRFAGNVGIDSRVAADLGNAALALGALPGRSGPLEQVTRPEQVQQFDLAQLR